MKNQIYTNQNDISDIHINKTLPQEVEDTYLVPSYNRDPNHRRSHIIKIHNRGINILLCIREIGQETNNKNHKTKSFGLKIFNQM